MAGTGKSTVSRTLARYFRDRGILGGSFFFKKGLDNCDSTEMLIPTLVNQLKDMFPILKNEIQVVIEERPRIFQDKPKIQFDQVLMRPLKKLPARQRSSIVFILDALDECRESERIEELVGAVPDIRDVDTLDVRFLVTGRPERAALRAFGELGNIQYSVISLGEIADTERDIAAFFIHKLRKISDEERKKTNPAIPKDWPGDPTIQVLTRVAHPLFIAASTICRFIGDRDFSPVKQLDKILDNPDPYNKLAYIYQTVLNEMIFEKTDKDRAEILEDFRRIIGSIVLLYDPLSVTSLADLLEVEEDLVERRLDRLRSVLVVPDDRITPIRTLHLSFRDFLFSDPKGSKENPFKLNAVATKQELVDQCLRVMSSKTKGLGRNICNLENDEVLRSEIGSTLVKDSISPVMNYACRYWVKHLENAPRCLNPVSVLNFFNEHFLHWLEAMSILGLTSEVPRHLQVLQQLLLPKTSHTPLSIFLVDAVLFVQRAGYIISLSPLQVYHSALVFTPQESVVRQEFGNQIPDDFVVLPEAERDWGALMQTSQGPASPVMTLEYTLDGRLLALSGHLSGDTIQLWDVEEAESVQVLDRSGDGSISFYAISPNGEMVVACGMRSGEVRLWHVEANSRCSQRVAYASSGGVVEVRELKDAAMQAMPAQRLPWPDHQFSALLFSPDGRWLVAFNPGSIRLWELQSNDPDLRPYTCSNLIGNCFAVAFSHDGRRLACGFETGVVQVWDLGKIQSDSLWGKSQTPSDSTPCISLSPDGSKLATSALEEKISLWCVKERGPDISVHLESVGTDRAKGFTFSPDGRFLAADCWHSPTKIWDTSDGTLVDTLDRDVAFTAQCFSSDGELLVCDSEIDGAMHLRIWKLAKDLSILSYEFPIFGSRVLAVVFTPDDRYLVTSLNIDLVEKYVIAVWDRTTGENLHKFPVSGPVRILRFSEDGRQILTDREAFQMSLMDSESDAQQATHEQDWPCLLAVLDSWIVTGAQRRLWLPPESRGVWSSAGNTLYVSPRSGQLNKFVLRNDD
ncbi:hypothetical protein BJY04DRAFT_222578 [Aspergillus karnatakaensis]|uniref:uncharacterized protein n=1 Tax=Aspergillus karnatakaensis TaxID=1810916 RepID=UPI003CCD467B